MYFVYFEHKESICPGISIIFRALQNVIEIPVLTFNSVKRKMAFTSVMFYVAKSCLDQFVNMPFMCYFAFFFAFFLVYTVAIVVLTWLIALRGVARSGGLGLG